MPIRDKKFSQSGYLKKHVKRIHVHHGVDKGQSFKHKKQVDTTPKRSEGVKNSKRMKMLEKEALNISNIVGFDHENDIACKEQLIKKEIKHEVKTEPVDENMNEEQKIKKEIKTEVKIEPIDENVDEEIEKQALDVSNIMGFDHENQTIDKEPKIKQEVKIEPMGENFKD